MSVVERNRIRRIQFFFFFFVGFLIEELVETAVLGAHEYATGRSGRAHHIDLHIVRGYGVDGLRREAHLVHNGTLTEMKC